MKYKNNQQLRVFIKSHDRHEVEGSPVRVVKQFPAVLEAMDMYGIGRLFPHKDFEFEEIEE